MALSARRKGDDYTRGVAITSSFFPDGDTHIEPVRYGRGCNEMGSLRTLLVDGDGQTPRWAKFLGRVAAHPLEVGKVISLRHWSERTIIALVMQGRDNSITVQGKRGRLGWGMRSRRGHGEPNPVWIPKAHRSARLLAEEIGGTAFGTWTDLFDIPMTAHFLGGCTIGDSAATGVIDPYHRVYGYQGLHIVDGSAVSANLGVNPALTITAQAERHGNVAEPGRCRPTARPGRLVPAGGAGYAA